MKRYFLLFVTVIVAEMLSIWPLFSFLQPFRPQWVLVLILFWIYWQPNHCGIGLACLLGIIQDALIGTPLGLYGLIFSFVSYLFIVWLRHFQFFSIEKQAIAIVVFTALAIGLRMLLQGLSHQPNLSGIYFLSAVSSGCVWLLLCFIFKSGLNRLQSVVSWA